MEVFIDYNGKKYIDLDRLEEAGIKKSTVYTYIKRKTKGWNSIPNPENKNFKIIEISPLPEKYKSIVIAKYGDPNNPLANLQDEIDPLGKYSNKDLELAQAKRNLVVAFRNASANAKGKKVEVKKEWVNLVELGLICQKEYEIIGKKLSFPTLQRWDKIMRNGQNIMDDLLIKQREIKVGNELDKIHKDTLIKLYCGQNQLKFSECIRLAQKQWKILNIPIVSDIRCRKFLTKWAHENASTATFLRRGIKALRDDCLPYIERDEDSLKFMDVLVADGHVLNFQIVNPLTGKMCRPTLIAWVDMATRLPVGFEIMYTENTRAVLSAFRNACLNAGAICGIEGGILPRAVYMDNGKSFKNKFFTAEADLENDLGGLFERLRPFGLEHIAFARPYNARAKVIERVFRDFGEIERQLPTYCGINIDSKPASLKRNEVWHRQQFKNYIDNNGKVTLQGSYLIIKDWINEFAERESDGKYLKGRTPLQAVYEHIPELDFQTRTLAITHYDYMLMHTKVGRLQRNGFNIGGVWYYNALHFANVAKDDTEYIVKFDVLNPDRILIYHEDETFWCSARPWIGQKVHAMAALGSDADREKVAQSNRMLFGIEKSVTSAAKSGHFESAGYVELPASTQKARPDESVGRALPDPELVLVEKNSDDGDYVTTQDGRKIKLKYF